MSREIDPQEIQTIADLFAAWKEKHKSSYCPEDEDHMLLKNLGSFCRDGVTSAAGNTCADNEDPHVDVLFVLKEANLKDDHTGRFCPETDKRFWFDECVDDENRKQYCGCFETALACIGETDGDMDTKRFGYMNINKRGGGGKTNMGELSEYAKCHAEYIRRQIELHEPRYIVFCGCFDGIADVLYQDKGVEKWKNAAQKIRLDGKETTTTLLYMYHPSWRFAPKMSDAVESRADRLKTAIADMITNALINGK